MAANNDVEGMRALLKKAPEAIGLSDYDKRHALHLAAEEGHLEAVTFLIEAGANINCVDRWGITPLGGAALYGHNEIQDYLRSKGGNVGDGVFSGVATKLKVVRQRQRRRLVFQEIDKPDSVSVSRHLFDAFIERRFGLDVRIHKVLQKELEAITTRDATPSVQWQNLSKYLDQYPHAILSKAFHGHLAIPDWHEFIGIIKDVFEEVKREVPHDMGLNAQYIPELADVNPHLFSVSVVSCDGQTVQYGDYEEYFSMQSCMKPLLYSFNLAEVGAEYVHRHVGREPSGAAFNAFTLNADLKPHNSCINAGAIMNSALYHPELALSKRFGRFNDSLRHLAGGFRPTFSQAVYLSEKGCAYNNMALAYFMKAQNAFPEKVDFIEAVDFYFQLCSIEVTSQLLASVASTYANNGVNPLTNEKMFSEDIVKANLQLMFSAGMYDFSGEWACTVGLPAKSGVGGAIYFVVPNVAGVCVHSPPLDDIGNSCRAVEFCKRLKRTFVIW